MLQSRKIHQPGIKYLNSDHVRTSARTHERTRIFRELSGKYIPTRYQTSHSGHARTCARKHARTITLRELSGYFPRFFRRTQAAERLTLQQHRQQAHAEAGIRVKKAGEPKTDIKEKKNTHTHTIRPTANRRRNVFFLSRAPQNAAAAGGGGRGDITSSLLVTTGSILQDRRSPSKLT